MKCELCISNDNGAEIRTTFSYESPLKLVESFYLFIDNLIRGGWLLYYKDASIKLGTLFYLGKNENSVYITLRRID